jgi:hypothetical protein
VANKQKTDGYNALMDQVRLDADPCDPWGSNIKWLFSIAETVYMHFAEILTEYEPSYCLHALPLDDWKSDAESDYHLTVLSELIDAGPVTLADLKDVYAVLSRYDNWLVKAGKSY